MKRKYRNEWKYYLHKKELSLVQSRIDGVLSFDNHTNKDGKYTVHTLYFDDYKNNSLLSIDAGLCKRYKWRIRYYNDNTNYIKLERKEKFNNRSFKKSVIITKEEYKKIISGDICDILYDTDKELIKLLARDMMLYHFTPKVIIDYERVAYVDDCLNIRCTFDEKISSSMEIDKFLEGNYLKKYIVKDNYGVLEIKFDYILPSYLKKILSSNYNQTPFSKYYYGIINGGSYVTNI